VPPPPPNRQAAPAFSRDGTRVMYMNAVSSTQSSGSTQLFDVVVADSDGSHPVVVAHDVAAGSPIWSPDGRWLVWSGSDDHAFVASADGSGVTDIGKIGAGAWTPSWAPDSQHLAVAAADGILWLVNRDGTGARRLSRGQYDEVGEKGWSADWSPDGSKLLFGGLAAGVQSLYLVGLDGAPERLVSARAWNGVWSPDGSMIAYVRQGIPSATKLVIADANGREIRVLEGDHGWYMPAWSPDQMWIAILDDYRWTSRPPAIVLLDPLGVAPPVTLPAGQKPLTGDTSPDDTLTWQRVAP
jgi:Tol biopolymer transport system component